MVLIFTMPDSAAWGGKKKETADIYIKCDASQEGGGVGVQVNMGSASETCKFDFPSEGWLDMERGMSSKGGGITWRQPKCESISDCVREPDRDHLEVKTKPISHLSTLQATEKLSKKSSLCFLSADILSITTSSLFLHILKIFPKISCWNHKNPPPSSCVDYSYIMYLIKSSQWALLFYKPHTWHERSAQWTKAVCHKFSHSIYWFY